MKLSAIFISVNLATTLPLAAQAAEGVVSEDASWLKTSLVTMTNVKPARKLSLSEGAQSRNTLKMMPFMPNRPLPKQKDLVVQQPNSYSSQDLQAVSDKPLATQVSDYPLFANSKQTAFNSPAGPIPRAIPDQIPTLPGQVAANRRPSIPAIPEPPTVSQNVVDAPVLTPDERAMMRQLVELNQSASKPTRVATAGPAPFPLNLLPQDSLKEFIGHGHKTASAPPSYFGSWHQRLKVSSLPAGGFQSHLAKQKTNAAKYSQRSMISKAPLTQHRSSQHHSNVIAAQPIATYAPYTSSNTVMTF